MSQKISRTFSIEFDLYEKFEKISSILYSNNSEFIRNSIINLIEQNQELLEKINKNEENLKEIKKEYVK